MSIYEQLGVRTILNAKGPSTRVSGGLMAPEVTAAMAEAATHCVDMAELQAAASRVIAGATGAEAGMLPPAPRPACCSAQPRVSRASIPAACRAYPTLPG